MGHHAEKFTAFIHWYTQGIKWNCTFVTHFSTIYALTLIAWKKSKYIPALATLHVIPKLTCTVENQNLSQLHCCENGISLTISFQTLEEKVTKKNSIILISYTHGAVGEMWHDIDFKLPNTLCITFIIYHTFPTSLNLLKPSDAYMPWWTWPSLAEAMAWCLFRTKPLPEPTDGILSIKPKGINYNEILNQTLKIFLPCKDLKMSSTKYQPFCSGLNLSTHMYQHPGRGQLSIERCPMQCRPARFPILAAQICLILLQKPRHESSVAFAGSHM